MQEKDCTKYNDLFEGREGRRNKKKVTFNNTLEYHGGTRRRKGQKKRLRFHKGRRRSRKKRDIFN